ncbi:hypothetical protein LCGC14_2209090 [marine sediment metagenome]|uniref:Helix-turn-helix type 11 domain-containing protein n=1 Tax=marine sediment metagenome TaxID=412755 RepID=A0A0F9GA37_9ZZZZ
MNGLKGQLKAILLRREGHSQAIKARDLAELLRCDERKVRLMIRELIREGLPVASSTEALAGYFIVATRQEAEQYAGSVRSRLIEDALRRRDFRRAADQYLTPAEQGRLV